jgi:DNA helicase-2/ATP-dependent DNA helicase PcrA
MPKKFGPKTLNEAQEKAVLAIDGPVLIVAGAGSGKTLVLAHRIAHLIEKGVRPESILAVTFTNKAAGEMRDRILRLLKRETYNLKHPWFRASGFRLREIPWIGTFHALGAYILRESGGALGISKSFSILDEEDSLSLIKDALEELELDPKKFEPRRLRSLVSRKKNEMEKLEDFVANSRDYFPKILAKVWTRYEERLRKSDSLDFDDLLLKVVELFTKEPEILRKYQEHWKYIQVDEYQDTNIVQYHLTHLLAKEHKNLCVVGDIDQAIYSWRGADFRNILHFERDWPEAKVITLEENYRSTQLILDAANTVIVKNKMRVPKNLFSKKTSREKITLFEASNEEEESDIITELIKNEVRTRTIKPEEIAVLFRTNFQSRILEEKMLESDIPYQVVGVKFYERREIKDALSYLKSALNPDDLLSLKRIINLPPRGIGKVLAGKFLAKDRLGSGDFQKISEFQKLLAEVKKAVLENPSAQAIKLMLKKTGLKDYFNDGTQDGQARISNLEELVTLAKRYDEKKPPEGILKLLEDAALMSEQDTIKEESSVKLMTVHAAKGLEFKIVFIAGLEEGLFPHRALSDEEIRQLADRAEEERRLFYVALTRAKEKIYLSWAVFRTIFGEKRVNLPSSFLFDIPDELLERGAPQIIILE